MEEIRDKFLKSLKVETGDMQDIPVEDNTQEDYEKWKKERNKRVMENPKWKRQQKELLEDLENEFNERNRGGYGR